MAKQSQLDKAIASLKADRAVLDLAIARLEAQAVLRTAMTKVERRKAVKRTTRRDEDRPNDLATV